MIRKYLLGFCVLAVLSLHSCLIPRKIVYVKDMVPDSIYEVEQERQLRIQKNDRLSIVISAKNPELAAPFNQIAGSYRVGDDGSISTTNSRSIAESGYLVDQNGHIEFPLIGTIQAEGMTLTELKEHLKSQIETQRLIVNPTVKVELMNMKVSVIGAVSGQKILNVPDSRLNLIEAITMAGGLSSNANTKKIAVIREEEGKRQMILTDIESKEIFDSPVYHLQQNDIIYVLPKTAQMTPREDRGWRYYGTVIGLVSAALTFMLWSRR